LPPTSTGGGRGGGGTSAGATTDGVCERAGWPLGGKTGSAKKEALAKSPRSSGIASELDCDSDSELLSDWLSESVKSSESRSSLLHRCLLLPPSNKCTCQRSSKYLLVSLVVSLAESLRRCPRGCWTANPGRLLREGSAQPLSSSWAFLVCRATSQHLTAHRL
jgi:hypothetical protein